MLLLVHILVIAICVETSVVKYWSWWILLVGLMFSAMAKYVRDGGAIYRALLWDFGSPSSVIDNPDGNYDLFIFLFLYMTKVDP